MFRKLLKLSLVCVAGTILITANPKTVKAYEEAVAGYPYDKDTSSIDDTLNIATATDLSIDIPIPGFKDVAIADVDTNLLIRSGAGENYKIIGKLPKNGGCEVLEGDKDGWTKISAETSSGDTLVGYVNSDYLVTGSSATQLAKQVGNFVATVTSDGLRLRKSPSTDSDIIDTIGKGEELLVVDDKVITDDPDHKIWIKVSLDSDTDEGGTIAYVAKDYVDLSFELVHALSMDEIQYGAGVSGRRIDIVNFARNYLGGRYVWGGTSLTHGVDCSGFMQQIYKNFGIYIPRTSREQARSGDKVSASELKPGDLVFYGSSSYISHVAMYIGNGKVIHASNHRDGIKISNMYYRSPVKCVTFIND